MTKAQDYINQIKASSDAVDTLWLWQEITDTNDVELIKTVHKATAATIAAAVQSIGGDNSIFMNDPRFAKRILTAEKVRIEAEQKKRGEERKTGLYELRLWRKYQDLNIIKDGDLIEIDLSYIPSAVESDKMTISEAHRIIRPFLKILKLGCEEDFYNIGKINGMIMFDDTNGNKSMYFHSMTDQSHPPLRIEWGNRSINSDYNGLTKFKIIQSIGK